MKKLLQRWLQRRGIRLSRTPGNRFEVIGDVLTSMKARRYEPRVVIDAGANHGQFFEIARPVFPNAAFHLVEPQAACRARLDALAAADKNDVQVHQTVLTEPGVEHVRMVGGGGVGGSGNWVARETDDGPDAFHSNATTLDVLLDEAVSRDDRALLKLDLENHELPALRGASSLLDRVEAVLTEVTFFDINDQGLTLFAEISTYLESRGFALYDVASLAARPRDGRLRLGDVVFVRDHAPLASDNAWE